MDRQAATQHAQAIFKVAQRMELVTREGAPTFQIVVRDVRDLLEQLVPDGDGIAVEGDRPRVLVAGGGSLFVLSLVIGDGSYELQLASAPLNSALLIVRVEEWYERTSRGLDVRHRRWMLSGGSLEHVSVRTEDYIGEEVLVEEERFLRQLAAKIGWQAPA